MKFKESLNESDMPIAGGNPLIGMDAQPIVQYQAAVRQMTNWLRTKRPGSDIDWKELGKQIADIIYTGDKRQRSLVVGQGSDEGDIGEFMEGLLEWFRTTRGVKLPLGTLQKIMNTVKRDETSSSGIPAVSSDDDVDAFDKGDDEDDFTELDVRDAHP